MRVFVALALPHELLDVAARYQDVVRSVPGVRLLDYEGLHATIIPPWDEKDPAAVLRDFSAVSSPPVEIAFDHAGYNRTHRGESLIWLKGSVTPEIEKLWLQTWRAVMSQDPPRPPFPHVTLARFASSDGLPSIPPLEGLSVTFDRLCLYESQGNLTYRVIGERQLGV